MKVETKGLWGNGKSVAFCAKATDFLVLTITLRGSIISIHVESGGKILIQATIKVGLFGLKIVEAKNYS